MPITTQIKLRTDTSEPQTDHKHQGSLADKDMKLKLYEIESAIRDHKEKRGLELCAELRGLLDGG